MNFIFLNCRCGCFDWHRRQCGGLLWAEIDNLPKNIIPYVANVIEDINDEIKTQGTIDDIVTGVIRGETISQEKLDEIIRKVKLALGDA